MGFVIGPVIGGFLGEYGSRMPFIAAALLSFASMLFGYLVLKESLPPKRRRHFQLARANPLGTSANAPISGRDRHARRDVSLQHGSSCTARYLELFRY